MVDDSVLTKAEDFVSIPEPKGIPYPMPKNLKEQNPPEVISERRSLNPFGRKWPLNIILRIPRMNGEEWFFDKARRIVDKKTGEEWYRLKKRKTNAKPIAFNNVVRTNRGLYTEVYCPNPHEFYSCRLDKTTVKPLNEDQKQFYASETDRAHTRWQKKSWWDKYSTIVIPVALIGIFAISLVFIMYGANEYALPAMNRLGAQIAEIAEKLGMAASQVSGAASGIAPVA